MKLFGGGQTKIPYEETGLEQAQSILLCLPDRTVVLPHQAAQAKGHLDVFDAAPRWAAIILLFD